MYKKIAFAAVAVALVASPILVSADTGAGSLSALQTNIVKCLTPEQGTSQSDIQTVCASLLQSLTNLLLTILQGNNTIPTACPAYQPMVCSAGQHLVLDAPSYDQKSCQIPNSHCVPNGTPASSTSFSVSPTSGVAPLLVTVTGTTTGNFELDFGDGSRAVWGGAMGISCIQGVLCSSPSIALHEIHTYSTPGTYRINLQSYGLPNPPYNSITTSTVVVGSSSGHLLTSTPSSGTAPLTVAFSYQISAGQLTDSYSVDFGDGHTASANGQCAVDGSGGCSMVAQHTYTYAGTYVARIYSQSQCAPKSGIFEGAFHCSQQLGTATVNVTGQTDPSTSTSTPSSSRPQITITSNSGSTVTASYANLPDPGTQILLTLPSGQLVQFFLQYAPNGSGTVSFSNVPPGSYILQAQYAGSQIVAQTPVFQI